MKVKNKVKENIAVATEKANKTDKSLSPDLQRKMNAYWRAANYLSVGPGGGRAGRGSRTDP